MYFWWNLFEVKVLISFSPFHSFYFFSCFKTQVYNPDCEQVKYLHWERLRRTNIQVNKEGKGKSWENWEKKGKKKKKKKDSENLDAI